MSANLENSAVATGLQKVSFHSNHKAQDQRYSNYHTIALTSHTSKVMLKILKARLQLRTSRCTSCTLKSQRIQRSNCQHRCIIEKAREFQKNVYLCFIDYAKAFDSVDHNKLWKILKEMGMPDHLTYFLRNLYAGQETSVRTRHGKTFWFKTGKGLHQGCIL